MDNYLFGTHAIDWLLLAGGYAYLAHWFRSYYVGLVRQHKGGK